MIDLEASYHYYHIRNTFYVYTYAYPGDFPDCQKAGKVFYVGEGQGKRIDAHLKEARKGIISPKCNTIREIWDAGLEVVRKKEREGLTYYGATGFETELINMHKNNGVLTNGIGPKYGKHDKPKISIKIISIQGDVAKRFRRYAASQEGCKLTEEELTELASDIALEAIEAYCSNFEQEQKPISESVRKLA